MEAEAHRQKVIPEDEIKLITEFLEKFVFVS